MRNRILRVGLVAFAAMMLLSGAGCFFTSEPPPAGCTSDGDCNTGFICESGSCVTEGGTPNCDGDLRVTWEFNSAPGCPEDVQDIVIKLFDQSGNAIHTNPQGDPVSCDAGEKVFSNLNCGAYQLQVQATDGSVFTWSTPQTSVDVVDGQTAAITANLAPE